MFGTKRQLPTRLWQWQYYFAQSPYAKWNSMGFKFSQVPSTKVTLATEIPPFPRKYIYLNGGVSSHPMLLWHQKKTYQPYPQPSWSPSLQSEEKKMAAQSRAWDIDVPKSPFHGVGMSIWDVSRISRKPMHFNLTLQLFETSSTCKTSWFIDPPWYENSFERRQ